MWCDAGKFSVDPAAFAPLASGDSAPQCWLGNVFGVSDTEQDFTVVKVTFECLDPLGLPRFKQCNVAGFVPFAVAISLTVLLMYACCLLGYCCRRRRRTTVRHY